MLAIVLENLARPLRLAALAFAVALVATGGASATMASASDSSVAPSVADAVAPVFDQAACDAARNHGAYVSGVAAATQGLAERGALVSAAAHSDCGKKTKTERADKADKAAKVKGAETSHAAGKKAPGKKAPGKKAGKQKG